MKLVVTLPTNMIAPQPFSPVSMMGHNHYFKLRLADGKDLLSDALTTITDKNATTKMTDIAIKVITS
jgi:hypothetical protein